MSGRRLLDGTYWRVRWDGQWCWRDSEGMIGGTTFEPNARDRWSRHGALKARRQALKEGCTNIELVRIRPRVSLVVAVRRCVEAREKGVELWMRRADSTMYGWYENTESYWGFDDKDVLMKWVVFTPPDAKRIDARAAKKASAR